MIVHSFFDKRKYSGAVVRKEEVLEYLIKKFCPKYRKAILSLVFVLCCLFYELVRIKAISFSIDTIMSCLVGYVSSAVLYLFASLFGWIMLYFVADLISEINLGNGLRYIGQHSLPVVLLHFLSFKLVSAVYCLLTDNPMLLIAWYSSIKISGNLWLYYGVVGVVVPIACYEVYIRAKKQVIDRT